MFFRIVTLIVLVCPIMSFGQIDELKQELKSIDTQVILDKFIFSSSSFSNSEVIKIKEKTRRLRDLSRIHKDFEGFFLASHIGFVFNVNPFIEDSCSFYISEMKRANKQLKSDSLEARICKNEAFIFGKKNEPEKELELLIKAAEGFEKYKDIASLAGTYMNLGVLFSKRNNLAKKKFYEEKALELSKKIPGKFLYSRILLNRGFALEYSQPDSAIELSNQIIKNGEKSDLFDLQALALHLKSGAFLTKKEYAKSLNLCQSIQRKWWSYLHDGAKINSLFNQSEDYYFLKNYSEAEKQAFKALEIAEKTNAYYSSMGLHKHLSIIYEHKNEPEQALFHNKKHHAIKDSLYSISKAKLIQELETKYQTAQKERDIAVLKKGQLDQKKRMQLYSMLAFGTFVIVALIFGLYYIIQRNKALQANTDRVMLEQKLFRAQIDPHFTYNTLSSIQSFFLSEGNAKKGALYLAKFSKLLRNILKQSDDRFIPLSDEIDSLENYLQLQQLRHNENFEFEIILDPSISINNLKIPPMLIQPLVENAIIHGQVNQVDKGIITISFNVLTEKNLNVTIIDNGIGLSSQIHGNGLATNLIQQQLQSLSVEFKDSYALNIEGLSKGVKSTITIPYFKNPK